MLSLDPGRVGHPIIYKLDRGFRNHLDFVTFYHEFCEQYGKKIISVGEEGLDMSTPTGRMLAGILVQFAEWELQTTGDRRRQGQNVLRREARYGGGRYRAASVRQARPTSSGTPPSRSAWRTLTFRHGLPLVKARPH